MSMETPTFAVVGAVNHGKSSVVSTLAENDQVRVSPIPGETVECQRFWLMDLFVFYDTPGFQNALEALPELAPAAHASDPLSVFREFAARHRHDREFEAECILFEPILSGAGIIYVVDGSEPLLEIHAAEMEILRLTGQPRLAIINRTGSDAHVTEWKRRLGLHFNLVREFNAHQATFADRLDLLETLAGIEQSWKTKLTRAVAIFREEWEKRLADCAEAIAALLIDALSHREAAPGALDAGEARREEIGEELKCRFTAALIRREAEAHAEIIRLFGHNRVKTGTATGLVFDAELFSDETWRAFGLNRKQLMAAGAVGGAAAGAAIDLATAGHSIGLPTAIAAGIGAAGAFALGRRRPELKIEVPGLGQQLRLGGREISIGPYQAANFPWILIDRALAVFAAIANRAHARRDETVIETEAVRRELVRSGASAAQWEHGVRRECERLFALIRKGRLGGDGRQRLRELIRQHLPAEPK
jgi:hypothetical protein